MPMPWADSTTAGSTSRSPVMVLRTIGRRAYITRATTAGVVPSPRGEISRPNRANEGMVRKTPVTARTAWRGRSVR